MGGRQKTTLFMGVGGIKEETKQKQQQKGKQQKGKRKGRKR